MLILKIWDQVETSAFVKYIITGIILMINTVSFAYKRDSVFIPYVFSTSPDPYNILWSGDWVAASHAWQTLFELSENGDILPRIAKSWTTSIDGLTWTFEINKHIKWSNGQPITPDQIAQSLNISRIGTSHTDLSEAISSIKAESNKIIFHLKRKISGLLISLTYIDWAIVHPDTIKNTNGKSKVILNEPCSGPYCFNTLKSSQNELKLIANLHSIFKNSKSINSGSLVFFDECKTLIEKSDQILSFRSYAETFSDECKTKLEEKGFNIFRTQPTWILKADFTKKGKLRIKKEDRLYLLKAIQEKLVADKPQFGIGRATGLRASHLFGSLSESVFDTILSSFPKKASENNISIHVVTMQAWSHWKSFNWLIDTLKNFKGIELKSTILSKSDFTEQMTKGMLQNNYDLIFIPFGVGDPDPNGAWRIAANHIYPDSIDKNTVRDIFYETNKSIQEKTYQQLAKKLIESGTMIPLKMDADFVGHHNSVKIGDVPPFRVGLTLYDLISINK